MEKNGRVQSRFSKLLHVGVVVRDIDKAIGYLESIGFGPFELNEPPPTIEQSIFRGKPFKAKMRSAKGYVGEIAIELLQPVYGDSPASEFLEKRGEGIQHLGLAVDNLDEEINRLTGKEVKVIWRVKSINGGMAYLETDAIGGFLLELIQGE